MADPAMLRPAGWGPDRKPAAVSITFDNMGEAADIEFGLWPQDRAVGAHYSVTEALPAILPMLDSIRATFFVEAWNVGHYPDALRGIDKAGHEIGLHGWRHEIWERVPALERPALIDRCLAAFATLGLKPMGFRPPGGAPTEDLVEMIGERGFTYHSSVGDAPGLDGGVVALPFVFRDIDGFQIEHGMGGPAQETETEAEALDRLEAHVERTLDEAVRAGTHRNLIFHPWIIGKSPARLQRLDAIIKTIRRRDDLWIASGSDVASFLIDA